MKVKIIGGNHRGQSVDVQEGIVSLVLPDKLQAVYELTEPEPIVYLYKTSTYKLYKQYRYVSGEVVGYFVPDNWVHHEVERILMDASYAQTSA